MPVSARLCRIIVLLLMLPLAAFSPAGPCCPTARAAPKPELWSKWQQHDQTSTTRIDHSRWAAFLTTYLITNHPSGINRIRYGNVTPKDRQALKGYLEMLQGVTVGGLNRNEQKAYWINTYNALVVDIVLTHYPVSSIQDIDISGWFSNGPWKAKLLTIEGEKISLDDIEHRILRPIWKDNRVHYGVNCASIGCPNLQPEPFTAQNTDRLLATGAIEYINHPRGVHFDDADTLVISSIYDWFQIDFGGSEHTVLRHLIQYGRQPLANNLLSFKGDIDYRYDWRLNEPQESVGL